MSNIIPQHWKGAIERLGKLPDQDWLSDCRTSEQEQHWRDCKLFCWFLGKLLKDYFSGVSSDALSEMSKEDQAFWRLYRDRWIYLYGLIQDTWIEIRQDVIKDGLEASFPDQPGVMLLLMLESWAAGMFAPCVAGLHPELGRFSPRKEHANYRKQFNPVAIPKNLSEWQKRFSQADRQKMAFNVREIYCLLVCEKLAKKDRRLRHKLKEFQKIESEIKQVLYAQIHPRKQLKGHQWINGRKQPSV